MEKRKRTREIKIGNLILGGDNPILIQSMCNIKTSKVEEVAAQINRCASLGADLMRLSVLDEEDARSFKAIKSLVNIPLIADIHFDYKLALLSIENGADAIRINPGNIGGLDKVEAIVNLCKEKGVAIRVGANSGSIKKDYEGLSKAEALLASVDEYVKILESFSFHNIVISLKGSSIKDCLEAYRLASLRYDYPLHIGITEAGPKDIGIIRSAAGLSPILLEGIGNTIRISLSDEPEEEILACKRLLHDLGLYENYPTLISCPTCGRTQVNLLPLANSLLSYLEKNNINKKIAVMGCIVNGPGEAKDADLGCAGGHGEWAIFKNKKVIRTVSDDEIYEAMIEEINSL